MALDNFDILEFIFFGRYFVLLLSHMRHLEQSKSSSFISLNYVPSKHFIRKQKEGLTSHPTHHQNVSVMANSIKTGIEGFGKKGQGLTIVLSILCIRCGRGIVYPGRTATVQNLIELGIRRVCYP